MLYITDNMGLYLKGKQYKQPKQYIWEWFRAVVSEVPCSYKELFFPAD